MCTEITVSYRFDIYISRNVFRRPTIIKFVHPSWPLILSHRLFPSTWLTGKAPLSSLRNPVRLLSSGFPLASYGDFYFIPAILIKLFHTMGGILMWVISARPSNESILLLLSLASWDIFMNIEFDYSFINGKRKFGSSFLVCSHCLATYGNARLLTGTISFTWVLGGAHCSLCLVSTWDSTQMLESTVRYWSAFLFLSPSSRLIMRPNWFTGWCHLCLGEIMEHFLDKILIFWPM